MDTTVYKTLSYVPDSLFVERLEPPGSCCKEQIQTVPNEGHEGMQKQRKSKQFSEKTEAQLLKGYT